ncbi:tRNA epoxyqueuosine(34) reductase QueG [Paenibacillus caui]|uniref:tRNA epoxyqueuosine(34) reductase QueG n=1 Tax=Paenibacillus caui TaxID=2873927 RepID=UPI003B5863AC
MQQGSRPKEQQTGWGRLKEEIKEAAGRLGIDSIGFASADPFLSLKAVLEKARSKGYESGFEEPDIDKRVYPELTMTDAASIIAIAVAYPSKMENPPKSEPGKTRGIMARSAWGRDYHAVLREAMDKLSAFIKERVPEARIESMVDTGALNDRAVAKRAGIGFAGKNGFIISPEWGTWMYLGEMITNIPFPPDTAVTEDCGECTKCIDACPTGALVGDGMLNAKRCVSYLTQTKGLLDEEFMLKIGNRLYGCDTCQIVCPKNRGKNWNHRPELLPDPEIAKPLLLPLLDISNREFKDRFGQTAAAWRGKKPIQRNAVIALGNFKDRSAVPKLIEVLSMDPRPELRGTAAWALSRIGGDETMDAIMKAMVNERDEAVIPYLEEAKRKLLQAETAEETEVPAVYVAEMESRVGALTILGTRNGICLIQFGTFENAEPAIRKWIGRFMPKAELRRSPEALEDAVLQLKAYFDGKLKSFDLKLDLKGTPFQMKVWEALLTVPYGETVSYKMIAERIGQPSAVRAVGGANNRNPLPIVVPCHRVIGTSGAMTGYAGGLSVKESLLALEQRGYSS